MGQTLSHGVYLPNEGERNCYAGLASNWQILNTAVGAIAEKAPLVHTHTVSQITDFPAYGNAAGTICEGNDSRLSDARTPVAHTHTKSDVTDLFNSANTWSESNIFSKDCNIYNSDNSGSVATIRLRNSKAEVTSSGNVSSNQAINFTDRNNFACARVMCGVYSSSAVNRLLAAAKDTNGNSVETELQIVSSSNGTKAIFPTSDADVNLGNSAHRWKTLNGINPGALSLPGAYLGINDQIKDPNGQLNAIDLNGGSNTWVSDVDCYLYFYIPNNKFTWIRIFWPPTLVRCGQTFVPVPNETSDYSGFVPVPANTTVVIQVKGTQAPVFRRSACLGNV